MINKKKISLRNIKFGKNCKIIEPSNLYECELEDGVFVGPFVEIGKGVLIKNRTRISSHSFICELVTIGNDCFITMGSVINVNLRNDSTSVNRSTEIYDSKSKINRILKKKYFKN